jgi:hypothetical protein
MTIFKCPSCNYLSDRISNIKRHRIQKHNFIENTINENLDQISDDLNQNSENPNQNEQNCNILSENVDINTTPFKCDKCNKTLSNKRNLQYHVNICKGISNALECYICHKVFNNYSAKSKHLKTCSNKLAIKEQNTLSQQVINNTTINGNQTINNNNTNTINNTNITILAVDPNKLDQLEFVTDHITNPELKSILKLTHQDISNDKKINMLETYMRHLMTNPINKCIKKTNMQNVYSQIHTGNNKWETKHDRDLYPKLTCNVAQGFSGLMALRNSEKPMIKTERKLEELKAFLDYMSDEGYRNDSDPEINHQTHLAFKELVQRFKSVIFDVFKVNL